MTAETTTGTGGGEVAAAGRPGAPAIFAGDEYVARRFWEFFAVHIRNPNTRRAYFAAARRFAGWAEARGVRLDEVEPMVVAAYVETLGRELSPASVKQHLAAVRMLFDWLVVGQAVKFNPAAAVRGPRLVVRTGKTPALTAEETRALLASIGAATIIDLRDRALVAVMVYSFARVSAAVGLRVRDYYTQGRRSYFRLHEKGGRYNAVPAHHRAREYVEEYVEAAGIGGDRDGALFRAAGRRRQPADLSARGMTPQAAERMVKRRARRAGLPPEVSPHSFRATGITEFLRNGGREETAAMIAGHESTRTTRLYNRLPEEITLDDIERIHI